MDIHIPIEAPQNWTLKSLVDNKLSDEEIWLRAYCSAISSPIADSALFADSCLEDFKKRFRAESQK